MWPLSCIRKNILAPQGFTNKPLSQLSQSAKSSKQITFEMLHASFTAGKNLPVPRWRPLMLLTSGLEHSNFGMLEAVDFVNSPPRRRRRHSLPPLSAGAGVPLQSTLLRALSSLWSIPILECSISSWHCAFVCTHPSACRTHACANGFSAKNGASAA